MSSILVPRFLSCACFLAALGVMTSVAEAGSLLLDESFAGRETGPYRGTGAGAAKIKVWAGPPEQAFGSFELVEDAEGRAGVVLAVRDSSAGRDQAPAFICEWPMVPAGAEGEVVIEFKYKVVPPAPSAGGSPVRYRADILVGGAWGKAVCNVLLENGQIRLHDGSKIEVAGRYESARWQSLRLVVDMSGRAFSLSVDDRLLANRYPWVNAANQGLGGFTIKADMSPTDREGGVVLLLSDLRVSVSK